MVNTSQFKEITCSN